MALLSYITGRSGGSVGNLETLCRWNVNSNLGVVTRTGIFPTVGITNGAKGSLVLNFLTLDWAVLNFLTPDWIETHTKPAHCHGSLLLRLGRHTKPKTKPNRRRTQNQPTGYFDPALAINLDHAVSCGVGRSGLALAILFELGRVGQPELKQSPQATRGKKK